MARKPSDDTPTSPPAADQSPQQDPPKKSGDAKLSTVSEHRRANFPEVGPRGKRRQHPDLWRHASAAALHCWAQHAHHEAAEMRLSAEDYAKALEAGATLDDKGHTKPHEAALYVVKGK